MSTKPLLIFDLDETLVHVPDDSAPFSDFDFSFGKHHGLIRPHAHSLLHAAGQLAELAVWSSSDRLYVRRILSLAFPAVPFEFAWGNERCTARRNVELDQHYWVKDLRKVKKLGYDLAHVLIVDDSPEKAERNYGNLVPIRPFLGSNDDDDLIRLEAYLPQLLQAPNLRTVDKRGWWRAFEALSANRE